MTTKRPAGKVYKKLAVKAGVYRQTSVDPYTGQMVTETVYVSPQYLRKSAWNTMQMMQRGLDVPVCLDHQESAVPKRRNADVDGWLANEMRSSVGLLKSVKYDPASESHEYIFEVRDPEIAKKIDLGIIKRVSPNFHNEFSPGDGTRWPNVVAHLALTFRPKDGKQSPDSMEAAAVTAPGQKRFSVLTPARNSKVVIVPMHKLEFSVLRSMVRKQKNGEWHFRSTDYLFRFNSHAEFESWLKRKYTKTLRMSVAGKTNYVLYFAVVHAPVGGVRINGRLYKGGQFIPTVNLDGLDQQTRQKIQESTSQRTAARSAKAAQYRNEGEDWHQAVARHAGEHSSRPISEDDERAAARRLKSLQAHHGDQVMERIASLAGQESAQLAKLSPDDPKAEHLKRRLRAYARMAEHMQGAGKAPAAQAEQWDAKNNSVTMNGKEVAKYDFDSDSDSFWVSDMEGGKGQKSFDTKQQMIDYVKKNHETAGHKSALAEMADASSDVDTAVRSRLHNEMKTELADRMKDDWQHLTDEQKAEFEQKINALPHTALGDPDEHGEYSDKETSPEAQQIIDEVNDTAYEARRSNEAKAYEQKRIDQHKKDIEEADKRGMVFERPDNHNNPGELKVNPDKIHLAKQAMEEYRAKAKQHLIDSQNQLNKKEAARSKRMHRAMSDAADMIQDQVTELEKKAPAAPAAPAPTAAATGPDSPGSPVNPVNQSKGQTLRANKAWKPGQTIRSDDPNAVEALQAKHDVLKRENEIAKKANAIIRKYAQYDRFGTKEVKFDKGKTRDEVVADLVALGLSDRVANSVLTPPSWGELGFPAYHFANNNGQMAQIRKRMESVGKEQTRQAAQGDVETEYSGGVTVKEDTGDGRIKISFPGKPSREVIESLKRGGFRWSPTNGTWQRHLNNGGRYAVDSVLSKHGFTKQEAAPETSPAAAGQPVSDAHAAIDEMAAEWKKDIPSSDHDVVDKLVKEAKGKGWSPLNFSDAMYEQGIYKPKGSVAKAIDDAYFKYEKNKPVGDSDPWIKVTKNGKQLNPLSEEQVKALSDEQRSRYVDAVNGAISRPYQAKNDMYDSGNKEKGAVYATENRASNDALSGKPVKSDNPVKKVLGFDADSIGDIHKKLVDSNPTEAYSQNLNKASASAMINSHIGSFLRDIDNKIKSNEPITPDEEAAYDAIQQDKHFGDLREKLSDLGGAGWQSANDERIPAKIDAIHMAEPKERYKKEVKQHGLESDQMMYDHHKTNFDHYKSQLDALDAEKESRRKEWENTRELGRKAAKNGRQDLVKKYDAKNEELDKQAEKSHEKRLELIDKLNYHRTGMAKNNPNLPEFVKYAHVKTKDYTGEPNESVYQAIKDESVAHARTLGHDAEVGDAIAKELAKGFRIADEGEFKRVVDRSANMVANDRQRKQDLEDIKKIPGYAEAPDHIKETIDLNAKNGMFSDRLKRLAESMISDHQAKTDAEKKMADEKVQGDKRKAQIEKMVADIAAGKTPENIKSSDMRTAVENAMKRKGDFRPSKGDTHRKFPKSHYTKDDMATRHNFQKLVKERGYWSDGKAIVAVPDDIRAASKGGEGAVPSIDPILQAADKAKSKARIVGEATPDDTNSFHKYLIEDQYGNQMQVAKDVHASVASLHPDAEIYIPETSDGVGNLIYYKKDGKTVGVAVPLTRGDKEPKATVQDVKHIKEFAEPGPYKPEQMKVIGNMVAHPDMKAMVRIRSEGNKSAKHYKIDGYHGTYATENKAKEAAKELLSYIHGTDEGDETGDHVFKPKGQKTQADEGTRRKLDFHQSLNDHIASRQYKKSKVMQKGDIPEGKYSTKPGEYEVTEHDDESSPFKIVSSPYSRSGGRLKKEPTHSVVHKKSGAMLGSWTDIASAKKHAALAEGLHSWDFDKPDHFADKKEEGEALRAKLKKAEDVIERDEYDPEVGIPARDKNKLSPGAAVTFSKDGSDLSGKVIGSESAGGGLRYKVKTKSGTVYVKPGDIKFAIVHAPVGGADADGKHYLGGQFVPGGAKGGSGGHSLGFHNPKEHKAYMDSHKAHMESKHGKDYLARIQSAAGHDHTQGLHVKSKPGGIMVMRSEATYKPNDVVHTQNGPVIIESAGSPYSSASLTEKLRHGATRLLEGGMRPMHKDSVDVKVRLPKDENDKRRVQASLHARNALSSYQKALHAKTAEERNGHLEAHAKSVENAIGQGGSTKFAIVHAPVGGTDIDGKHYLGGQFTPGQGGSSGGVVAKADSHVQQEKKQFHVKADAHARNLKLKPQGVNVQGIGKVNGLVHGDLAVHPVAGNWVVSHIPTGKRVALDGSKNAAVKKAYLLHHGLDWSNPGPKHLARLRDVTRGEIPRDLPEHKLSPHGDLPGKHVPITKDAAMAFMAHEPNYLDAREKYIKKNGTFDEKGELRSIPINTDEWREYIPGYVGTNAHVVHEAASGANKKFLGEMLQKMKGKGNNRTVILAGGGGSGKGTSVAKHFDESEYPIRIDQVSGHYDSLMEQFQKIKEAGMTPEMVFVDRPPEDAWKGVVGRAMSSLKKGEHPRTVPHGVAVQANLDARNVALRIAQENPDIRLRVIDNHDVDNSRILEDQSEIIRHLTKQQYNKDDIMKGAKEHVDELEKHGSIPSHVAKGLRGEV